MTPWTVACQALLSMGILQARILKWVAMPFSEGINYLKFICTGHLSLLPQLFISLTIYLNPYGLLGLFSFKGRPAGGGRGWAAGSAEQKESTDDGDRETARGPSSPPSPSVSSRSDDPAHPLPHQSRAAAITVSKTQPGHLGNERFLYPFQTEGAVLKL